MNHSESWTPLFKAEIEKILVDILPENQENYSILLSMSTVGLTKAAHRSPRNMRTIMCYVILIPNFIPVRCFVHNA